MTRLILIVLLVALVGSGCSDDGDEPEGFVALCDRLGQIDRDLNPFDIVTTGGPDEVEEELAEIAAVYEELAELTPDEPYPAAVLASTTTVPPTTTAEGEGSDGDDEEVPTPSEDVAHIIDVLGQVRDVLADHDYEVAAAEEDLRSIEEFGEPEQLAELLVANQRLHLLVSTECTAPATTTTVAEGGGESA